jgi:hypothetical protein
MTKVFNINTTLSEPTEELKIAMAELLEVPAKNNNIAWGSFVLTDDLPNGNGVRIPLEEFDNVIKTAEYMPVKMEFGTIKGGHADSHPLGVIAKLVKQVDSAQGNKIFGLAGLWLKERPNDIVALKDAIAKGEGVDISWELEYNNETFDPNTGIIDLRDIGVTAATVVGNPAYGGRTPMFQIAEQNKQSEDDKTLDEKELLQKEITELKNQALILEAKLAEAIKEVDEKNTALAELQTTLEGLQEFKDEVEEEKAKVEKLESVKALFTEYEIEKPEEYFTEKQEFLLGLEEPELKFMLEELKAHSPEEKKEDEASTKIPNLTAGNTGKVSTEDMLAYLKNRKK